MITIADIMTRDVFTLPASARADKAAWELSLRGITGAPVRDGRGRLVGVLSRSDLADPERSEGPLEAKEVQHIMTPALFTLLPSEPVSKAIKLMVREGIHRVIVMDENHEMVGIVTSSDVLGALSRGELADESFAPAPYGRAAAAGAQAAAPI
jgi:CBS-domain-containing membrane protein